MLLDLIPDGERDIEDVLADVVASSPVEGLLLGRYELCGPWSVRFESARIAGVHIVLEGDCWLRVDGEPPLLLERGDVVLLPRGSAHVLCSEPTLAPTFVPEPTDDEPCLARFGQGDLDATMLCALYRFERDVPHPVLALLPPRIVVRHADQASGAIASLAELLVAEARARRPGARTMVSRLLDMIFVEVVRAWSSSHAIEASGWLGALRDPAIGRVLAALHAAPEREVTIGALARVAGMSEATFKRRFTQIMGEAPFAYLARVRADRAARLLRDTTLPLGAIATRVGYASEYAFARAFKRWRGVAPGRYRTQRAS